MEDPKNIAKEPVNIYQKHYTYKDYLEFSHNELVEIINGKIFKMSPAPSTRHQSVSLRLSTIISNYFWNDPCRVFAAPFDVVLPVQGKDFMNSDRVVQPDICVIFDRDKIKDFGCYRTPDWIIEILSLHTTKKDLQDKFELYQESGVSEYWITEPSNDTVEAFVLEDGKYQRIQTYVDQDIAPVNIFPQLEVSLKEIFKQ